MSKSKAGKPDTDKVEFFRHSVGPDERARVAEVLEGVFLTTGAEVRAFESELAAFLSNDRADLRALGVSSCTAALHLALLTAGVGPGDQVITTPMTFIASANAVMHAGATPVFVDVEPATGLLDAAAVEAAITGRTRAVLAVHLYGHLCDMRALRAVCDRHGLALVEDAAHALEAVRDGVRPGQLGDAACFSFYATKNITSGEGGALVSRHPDRIDRARVLSLHGMSAGAEARYGDTYRHWDMVALGYKYNMTNIQAAMLRPQLVRIDQLHERRQALARRYEAAFAAIDGIDVAVVKRGATSARHLFTIWVPARQRDHYLTELGQRGIGVAVNYRAIHLLSYFRRRFAFSRGQFPNAESIGDRTISLPLYPGLSDHQQDRVIEAVRDVHAGVQSIRSPS
ncbi:MAG: DegT/DnrJ/EryC1/StrS aminotransferase family protein [Proteobacteria bacterium]|nr:DegT/DnrJ/EryC1/StrS aminotransferase family protein [Pseudomonadota bacterium]